METSNPLSAKLHGKYMSSGDGMVSVPALIMAQNRDENHDLVLSTLAVYRWRSEDFLLTTYLKNGTHFIWEIMMMLIHGSAEYIKQAKNICMIDVPPFAGVGNVLSTPRVLNTHYRLDVLPKEFHGRRTVLCIRNPKDTCVSLFHFYKGRIRLFFDDDATIASWLDSLTLHEFIRLFLYDGSMFYGLYFTYIEYMWQLAKDNSNIIVVYYEDLVDKPFLEIEKINKFMETAHSAEMIEQIAEATNFQKMKEGKSNTTMVSADLIYRKGQIGDWKQHFTVADNELFDAFLNSWSLSHEIPFRYT